MRNLTERPYIISKAAVTLDGFLDDDSPSRLLLSSAEDKAKVAELRSSVDAILVGAQTVRKDNPRLLLELPSSSPIAVVLSNSGDLPVDSNVFRVPNRRTIVFLPSKLKESISKQIIDSSQVEFLGEDVLRVEKVLERLKELGVQRLLVEGGAEIHKSFLEASVVDEFRLCVAPVHLGLESQKILPASLRGISRHLEKEFLLDSIERLGGCCIHHYLAVSQ